MTARQINNLKHAIVSENRENISCRSMLAQAREPNAWITVLGDWPVQSCANGEHFRIAQKRRLHFDLVGRSLPLGSVVMQAVCHEKRSHWEDCVNQSLLQARRC